MQHTTEREPIGAGVVGYTFRKHFRCHIPVRPSETKKNILILIIYAKIQKQECNREDSNDSKIRWVKKNDFYRQPCLLTRLHAVSFWRNRKPTPNPIFWHGHARPEGYWQVSGLCKRCIYGACAPIPISLLPRKTSSLARWTLHADLDGNEDRHRSSDPEWSTVCPAFGRRTSCIL